MKNKFVFISSVLLLVSSCGNHAEQNIPVQPTKPVASDYDKELLDKAQGAFKSLPELADKNMQNVITDERVNLGKILYFDTRLSKTGNNSCNSCHNLATYGVDNQATSKGDAGKLGDRNSPTVLNAALHTAQFWDGRAKDVEEQAGMPILNPVEMAIPNEAFLVNRLREIDLYKKLFKDAFPNEKNPINYITLRKSIGAFERTLITPSKFDDYLNGDVFALNDEEREGMKIFIETGCTQCHLGATLGGNMFQKFGKFADYRTEVHVTKEDEGKKNVTKDIADKDVFKVPSLRNIEKTGPYFHNGNITNLNEAVKIMAKLQLNKNLSDAEVTSIVVFLKTLTGNLPDDVKKAPSLLSSN
ncbi:MAG: cytochrome c peroxidase [Bacteroidia bacterium]